MASPLGDLGKLLGLELPEILVPPEFQLEDASVLDRMRDERPTLPLPVFDVLAHGLNEGAIIETAQGILANTQKMRAQLRRIQQEFAALNLPQSYAIWMLRYEMENARIEAERALVQRFMRAQAGPGNWATPGNPYPIDLQYQREVALARNHVHTNTMLAAIAADLGVPATGAPVAGFVLPLTPQERAVSEQMAAERFMEPRLTPEQRRAPKTWAWYPHEASAQLPARAMTYATVLDYIEVQARKLAPATQRGPVEQIRAARAASAEWDAFRQSIVGKWSYAALAKIEHAAQRATTAADPGAQWLAAFEQRKAAWIAQHPEVRGELAHAATLLWPHQRWEQWLLGQPYTDPGADGTNLDWLITVEVGKPTTAQQACVTARAQSVQRARQTGKPLPSFPNPC